MFLTKEKAEERLKSSNNLANATWIKQSETKSPKLTITEKEISLPGRDRNALSIEERTSIAVETRTGSKTQSQVANERGLSQYAVHAITTGKTKGIAEDKVAEVITQVKDRALDRLMSSLGLLTDDKLSGCSAKDLSVIASNMGRVVEKVSPKESQPDNINFIIYSPELRQEKYFETVEV